MELYSIELFSMELHSAELLLFIFQIRQNYIIIFLKIIWRANFLPANIKSIHPMQKYPQIIELSSCTRKMLVFIFLFQGNSLINSLISLGIYSTPKLSK